MELFVSDPSAARRWWEAFGFETYDVQAGGAIVWLRLAGQAILLRPRGSRPSGARALYGDHGPAIVLFTDDLDAELARLGSLGVEPTGIDGEPCCPVFTDGDGNWVQIVDPREHAAA